VTGIVKKIDKGVASAETAFLVLVVGALVLFAVVQVTLKLFGAGVPWLDMLVRYMVVWVGFLGGAVATYQGRHISIDVISRFTGGTPRRIMGIVVNLVAVVLLVVLVAVALSYIARKVDGGATAFTVILPNREVDIPEWWMATIIPAGFTLMAWHFLVHGYLCIVGEEYVDDGEGGES